MCTHAINLLARIQQLFSALLFVTLHFEASANNKNVIIMCCGIVSGSVSPHASDTQKAHKLHVRIKKEWEKSRTAFPLIVMRCIVLKISLVHAKWENCRQTTCCFRCFCCYCVN